jgi:hypothetical protein
VGNHDLVALIFAREVSDPLTSLVKTIDKELDAPAARRANGPRLGVHVVFCSDDPSLKQQLQTLLAKEGLKNVTVSVSRDHAQGPAKYRIAREAELTLVIYQNHEQVAANFVLDTVDLNAARTEDILKSLRNVLP